MSDTKVAYTNLLCENQHQSDETPQTTSPQPAGFPPMGFTVFNADGQYAAHPQNIILIPSSIIFREYGVPMKCNNCQASIITQTRYKNGALTWLLAGGICLMGFWLGCQAIPFCINSCKDVEHYCPFCNKLLGVYSRI